MADGWFYSVFFKDSVLRVYLFACDDDGHSIFIDRNIYFVSFIKITQFVIITQFNTWERDNKSRCPKIERIQMFYNRGSIVICMYTTHCYWVIAYVVYTCVGQLKIELIAILWCFSANKKPTDSM